ncbi:MAG: hypothetical protein WC028_12325 [Candidatus Obscuribacterales bacterium]
MKSTLESMLLEMRSSFVAVHAKIDDVDARLCQKIDEVDNRLGQKIDEVDNRLGQKIDNLGSELNERIDRIVLRMDLERKENESRFRHIDLRFDRLPAELAAYLGPFINTVEKMLDNHDKRIIALEQSA